MIHISIAIDAMGGDLGPVVTVPAALAVLNECDFLHLVLVGDQNLLEQSLAQHIGQHRGVDSSRIRIVHASQVVEMDEPPAVALRGKRDSSMRVALDLVRDGVVQACVSAGNTGALMAMARFVLKMLPGVDRPAILFPLPAQRGEVYMLDLGANVECAAEHLFQFAVMGSVLVEAIQGEGSRPRVGLLNVGSEEIKGTAAVKQASVMLQAAAGINYIGFVEGDDIYLGDVDVVVCDGFVGNVALKTSEGLAQMLLGFAKQEFKRNLLTRMLALCSWPILRRLYKRFNPDRYNGGSLLGLNGVVLKSHGGANVAAFAAAIRKAVKEVQTNVPEKIRACVASQLGDVAVS